MSENDQALEARARDLLDAAESRTINRPKRLVYRDDAMEAIVAALRESRNVSKTMYAEAYMSGRADGALNAIPEGYALVPVGPTDEMLLAGVREWDSAPADPEQIGCARDTYRAMLAAAITPPMCAIQHIEPEK